jgi:hypothetical protein
MIMAETESLILRNNASRPKVDQGQSGAEAQA